MSTNSSTIDHRTNARVVGAIPIVRRTAILSAAMLAVGFAVAGCDGNARTPVDPMSPNASVADAFDNAGSARGDEAGVAAVVATWDAAWNAGNADGIAALFVDDAEFINGRGQIARGVATIRANHAATLAGVFKGSHTQGTIRGITFVSGTAAVLDVDNDLTGFKALPPGTVATEPGLLRGRYKRLLMKRAGTWRILLMQVTNVAPTL
jgi:uncharacterized protein (TIGR02246 family)